MSDRLSEIRARLDAAITARNAGCWDEPAERELALNSDADIAWLLDRVEALEIAYRSSVPHFAKGGTDA